MRHDLVSISKHLSFVLRHHPGGDGLLMDAEGWVKVEELLQAPFCLDHGVTRGILDQVVAGNDKQRFEFSRDGDRIRARQGHSMKVDVGLDAAVPPASLFHGTSTRPLASIRRKGLLKAGRCHVHLSKDTKSARAVGARHGCPVVLTVRARAMHEQGHVFFLSRNGVWRT